MSVTINGTVCRNCFDVDWARKAQAEQAKKQEAEAAKKAKEASQPPRLPPDTTSSPNASSGPDATAGIDNQPATVLGGSLSNSNQAASTPPSSAAAAAATISFPPSLNILV